MTKSTPSKMLWVHSHVLQHKLVFLTKYVFEPSNKIQDPYEFTFTNALGVLGQIKKYVVQVTLPTLKLDPYLKLFSQIFEV